MATIITPPLGAVNTGTHLGAFTTDPDTVVVGSPPQWSDNSDATYAYLHRTGSFGGAAYARTEPITEGRIAECDVEVRARAAPGDGGDWAAFTVFAGRTSAQSFPPLFAIDLSIPDDGMAHHVSNNIVFSPELAAVQTDWSTVGFHIEIGNNSSIPVYIYDVWVQLWIEPIATRPATRLWPRKDGLGLSSAPRIVGDLPPGRLVGGYT